MPNFLSKLKTKIRGRDDKKGKKKHEPPYLPSNRPTILTPNSSTVALPQTKVTKPSSYSQPSFFKRFPAELRYKILLEAFGNQTIHMHLTDKELGMNYPLYRQPAYPRRKRGPHAKLSSWKEGEWNWWSCVCHRAAPRLMGVHGGEVPCHDSCESGEADWCEFWPGEADGKCYIGIMGWLRSSRQAYMEGVDVLYGTNTIHIASNLLISNLPRFILPQRLAMISSLEVRWRGPEPPDTSLEPYHSFLAVLSSSLPALEKLHISIEDLEPSSDYSLTPVEKTDNAYLNPIGRAISKMENIKYVEVAIPLSYFDVRRFLNGDGYVRPGYAFEGQQRVWKELPFQKGLPEPVSKHLTGYWICLGQMDKPMVRCELIYRYES